MSEDTAIVALVDDDPAVRDAVSFLLETVGIKCCSYASADAFLDGHDPASTSCIVLDIRMPGMSGLELQEELVRRGWKAPIVFITGHGDIAMAVRAMRNGAFDFIQKPFQDQELIDSINAALVIARSQRQSMRDVGELREAFETLSPREREVMGLVTEGKPNKVIAFDLGVSQRTVEIHRARVMQKMGARNLAELVRTQIRLEQAAPA
ncbi:MAG: response regulator transcription factor [Pseudomonadota bacterium]